MAKIIVAGGANLDRIIKLGAPLRRGGRTHFRGVETRWGGGGVNTGAALIVFGHEVSLAARVAEDETGAALLAALERRGLDLSRVTRFPGPAPEAVILLEPSGERSILLPSPTGGASLASLSSGAEGGEGARTGPDLLYIAARRLAEPLDSAFAARFPIVAQLPVDPDERRPARIFIASRSDFPDLSTDALWERARGAADEIVETLIVTDGLRDVTILGHGEGVAQVAPAGVSEDSIGAGDFFAAGVIHAMIAGASPLAAAKTGVKAARFFLRHRPI